MSDRLYRVLLERETELVDEVHRRLINSTARHYEEMAWDVLLHRIESLTAYFMISVRETPDHFTDYVSGMAAERIHEGFRLAETLTALRALEDETERIVIEDIPLPGRTPALAKITALIGAAKNELATTYMEMTEHGTENAVEATVP